MAELVAIGAAIASAFTAVGTAVTAAGIFGQILVAFVLTGAQMALAQATAPKKKAGGVGGSDAGDRQTIRDSAAPQRRIYGRALVGGVMFFMENKAPHLYTGFLIAAHEIDALEEVRINSTRVFLDINGDATGVPYNTGAISYFKVSLRLGTSTQPIDPQITAAFPTIPATFQQLGNACIVTKANYGASRDEHDAIWGQGFNPLFLIRGAKIYDPRKPTHLINDKSTWQWSDNPTLCIADYLRSEYGGDISSNDINWESVKKAADDDDFYIPLKGGGTEKRYTMNGVIDYDQEPFAVIQSMITSNRGRLVYIDGKLNLLSGVAVDPIATLHQGIIIGGFEYRGQKPRRELLNVVRTRFVSLSREYQVDDAAVYTRNDFIALDTQTLQATLSLPFTTSQTTAQRLAKSHMLDTRTGRGLSLKCNLEAIHIVAGDVVRVDLEHFPVANGLYSVEEASFSDGFSSVTFALSEYTPDIYAWNAATDEKDYVLTVTKAT